jgi:hypothetical protein
MSWFNFRKDYEVILKKEIKTEKKYNPLIPCKYKHRHIEDILQDTKEEFKNFGFKRF